MQTTDHEKLHRCYPVLDQLPADLLRRVRQEARLVKAPAGQELLAREGYDPVYGARPLKRTIQKEIVQPLALRLLKGDFRDGDTIVVDAEGGQITFKRAEVASPTV